MPEAVIVATARSPIGRAFKGSLKDVRPDDLAATMIRAALAKVPELDPAADRRPDARLRPARGRAGPQPRPPVAVQLGLDHLPGTTVTRYCSSSLQTTRMALHAIKAGEGDVFISAGVECVSRYPRSRAPAAAARTPTTRSSPTPRPAPRPTAAVRTTTWHDPREDGQLPDVYIAMGQTAENLATSGASPARTGRVRRPLAEPRREGHRQRLLGARDHPGDDARRHGRVRATTARAPASRSRACPACKPVFRPDGTVTAGNCCPLNDGAAAVVIMSDTKARRAGPHPAGPHRLDRRLRPVPGDHGARARSRRRGRRSPCAGMTHRRHRPGRDQRGVRRAGHPVLPRPRHRPRPAQRQRRRDRGRPPVRHDRRPHHHHADQRPAVPRQGVRPGDDVRRRRPGHGDGHRAPQLTTPTPISPRSPSCTTLRSGRSH